MKRTISAILALFLISSIIYGQETASVKIKKMSFTEAAGSGYVIKGGNAKENSRSARVAKAFKEGLKGRSFILATLPDDCPDSVIEEIKKLDDSKIIIITEQQLKTLPFVDGKRKTTFKNLINIGANTEQAALLAAEPGECLEGPFYTATCICADYLLMVEQIPVNHCSDYCWPLTGLYIMCAQPCWTVYVPCGVQP